MGINELVFYLPNHMHSRDSMVSVSTEQLRCRGSKKSEVAHSKPMAPRRGYLPLVLMTLFLIQSVMGNTNELQARSAREADRCFRRRLAGKSKRASNGSGSSTSSGSGASKARKGLAHLKLCSCLKCLDRRVKLGMKPKKVIPGPPTSARNIHVDWKRSNLRRKDTTGLPRS